MEVVLVVSLITLVVVICVMCLLLYIVGMLFLNGLDLTQVPKPSLPSKKDMPEKDVYTPDSVDETVPLDQFQPASGKSLTYVIKDTPEETILEEKEDVQTA